jgi:hypothetical protein
MARIEPNGSGEYIEVADGERNALEARRMKGGRSSRRNEMLRESCAGPLALQPGNPHDNEEQKWDAAA